MVSLGVGVGLALVGTAVVWVAGGRLESASERLGAHYGLPAVVQGAVIAAVGSSFPELTSVVVSVLLHGDLDLGVGAVVGSAVFNVLVIPGWSALRGRGLEADRDVVYKEAQFYMLAVAVLLLTFSLGVIYTPGRPTAASRRRSPGRSRRSPSRCTASTCSSSRRTWPTSRRPPSTT